MNTFIRILAFVMALLLVASWCQSLHPAFDALSQFRLYYMMFLLSACLWLGLARDLKQAIFYGLIMVVSGWLTAPFLPKMGPSAAPLTSVHLASQHTSPDQILNVVQFNMRFNNTHIEKAIAALQSVDPDVYIFQELTRSNRAIFTAIQNTHSYSLECASVVVGSVALASKHPFVNADKNFCSRQKGFLAAQLSINGKKITVSSLHTRWPWPFSQHQQIDDLDTELQNLPRPLILAGDFNSAPWAHLTQRIATLSHTNPVAGVTLTWRPMFLGLPDKFPSLLGLDQILHSNELTPLQRTVLQDGGSDHLPILTRFKF